MLSSRQSWYQVGEYIKQMLNNQLESILRYNDPPWTSEMLFAFKLGLVYTELAVKYFPDYKHGYPRLGDPRKSELFKICWKLMHDNKEKLKKEEFRPFIQAQLSILKNIKAGPAKELYYGPRCLIGKPAWGRWVVWQKHAKAQKTFMSSAAAEPSRDYKVELLKTKTVLENKIRPLNRDTLIEAMDNGKLFRMVILRDVSQSFVDCGHLVRTYVTKYPEVAKKHGIKLENASEEALNKYNELFKGVFDVKR